MMKQIRLVSLSIIFSIFITGCSVQHDAAPDGDNTISSTGTSISNPSDYRQSMRDFVIKISRYGKNHTPGFLIIPQNGEALVSSTGEDDGQPVITYLNAIDGLGREDLFYGYNRDNKATPKNETTWMSSFLKLSIKYNIIPLVTDYCSRTSYMDRSYRENRNLGFISFAAQSRELNIIATYPNNPYQVNKKNINSLSDVKNFLYLINPERYSKKVDFINALKKTNYDLLIIDLFTDQGILSAADIKSLKIKKNGSRRKVVAYMSIGEAEDYRFYWKTSWKTSPPSWMEKENQNWKGNYKVKYWIPSWQNVILGNSAAYLDRILAAGFDGVYLDIIDGYEYFEEQKK